MLTRVFKIITARPLEGVKVVTSRSLQGFCQCQNLLHHDFPHFGSVAVGAQNEDAVREQSRKEKEGSEYLQEKNKRVSAPRKSKESSFMCLFYCARRSLLATSNFVGLGLGLDKTDFLTIIMVPAFILVITWMTRYRQDLGHCKREHIDLKPSYA